MAKAALIGARDAAAELGVSHRRVLQLILGGRLPAQKIGKSYVVNRADLVKVRNRKPGRPWPKRKDAK